MKVRLAEKLLPGTLFIIPLLGAVGNFGYEQVKVLFFILSISLIILSKINISFLRRICKSIYSSNL